MSKSKDNAVLAIDAGGTYFKSALVDGNGEILPDSCLQAPSNSNGKKEKIIAAYEYIIRESFSHANGKSIEIYGIGIATPGPFDYKQGMSLMKHKFQAIKGISLIKEFHSLRIFDKRLPVAFMQDVHAFLSGEHWTGAVKNYNNIAAITLGTGLGFGIMQNGKILDNGKGGPCLSIFNRPYKDGILEDIASRRGIIARFQQHSGNKESGRDVHDIAEEARKGDAHAKKTFEDLGETLARELSGIFREYKTDAVLFGGQISRSFDLFGPAFSKTLFLLDVKASAIPGENISSSALSGVAKTIK